MEKVQFSNYLLAGCASVGGTVFTNPLEVKCQCSVQRIQCHLLTLYCKVLLTGNQNQITIARWKFQTGHLSEIVQRSLSQFHSGGQKRWHQRITERFSAGTGISIHIECSSVRSFNRRWGCYAFLQNIASFSFCPDWGYLIRQRRWVGPPGAMDVSRYCWVISGAVLVDAVDHVPAVRSFW